jgi:XRE family transcriptional regulator, aerobic/anaerobic benzoate catabolism transcriptional regulator
MEEQFNRNRLLKQIGSRVRALRTESRLTIKEMAERAELSQRFVIQLEAGQGNISIANLERVAKAFNRPIHDLIPPTEDDNSIRSRIWYLINRCTEEDLQEFYRWVENRSGSPPKFIALIGLRGAGKSTVGLQLSRRMKKEFIEVDSLIEKAAGMSLGEIFTMHGEQYYRRLEKEAIIQLFSNSEGCIMAPGGSIVTDPETWELIKRRCFTVWLHATPEVMMKRLITQGDTRPMKDNPSAMTDLQNLLSRREPLYAQSNLTIRTSNKRPFEIVNDISNYYEQNLKQQTI